MLRQGNDERQPLPHEGVGRGRARPLCEKSAPRSASDRRRDFGVEGETYSIHTDGMPYRHTARQITQHEVRAAKRRAHRHAICLISCPPSLTGVVGSSVMDLPSNLSTNPASPARSTQRITAEQLAAATRLREYWMQRSLARYDGDKHARESSSDPAFASLGAGSPALEEYQYNFAKRTELVVPNNSTHGQATNAIQSSD